MTVLVAAVLLIVAEIVALVEVARAIGVLAAIVILLLISASGPWLVRRAGFGVWQRTRQRMAAGEFPGREAVDGLVLLAGGLLVCIPGFITDVIGLLLLIPPVRALAGRVLTARLGGRLLGRFTGRMSDRRVVDVASHPTRGTVTGDTAQTTPDPFDRPLQPGDPPER